MSLKGINPADIGRQREEREELDPPKRIANNLPDPNAVVQINLEMRRADRDELRKLAFDAGRPYSALCIEWITRGMNELDNELKKRGKRKQS